jgi:hypothetical protein
MIISKVFIKMFRERWRGEIIRNIRNINGEKLHYVIKMILNKYYKNIQMK